MSRFLQSTCLFVLLTCSHLTYYSATRTWTATAGGSWAAASSWSLGGVPAANDDIIIPALSSTATIISNVPAITLNSLTFTGSGGCLMQTSSSGNLVTIRNSMYVPSTYTVTMGATGARIVVTLSKSCTATLDGYCFFDAGTTVRNFQVDGTLIVNATGGLIDPNPSSGSVFILSSGATLKTQKTQGITTTLESASGINTNVAVCFDGSYTYNSGANYEYNGTAGQITGTGLSQNTPNSVNVNLSAGKILTLTANTTISGSLTLSSGTVDLNGKTLTLGTSGASAGTLTRNAGFLFNGTFTRWFATSAVSMPSNSGLFPMGTSQADYRPLWVAYSSALTTAGNISVVQTATYPATYVAANFNDASWGNTVLGVSNSIWTISTNSIAFNGTSAQIRYGGTGYGTNVLTDLNASLVSSVTGSHSASTNANTTYEVNRINLSTLLIASAWRIGTRNTAASPLPITLIDFNAKTEGDRLKIYWTTGSETNNRYFVVEESNDGIHYEAIGIVNSKGDSNTEQDYYLYDNTLDDCMTYYRLKQVDYDGNFKLSKTIAVCNTPGSLDVNLFPNPSNGLVNFYANNHNAITGLSIYNAQGVKVFSADGWINTADLSALPIGIYSLNFYTIGGTISKKFFLNN